MCKKMPNFPLRKNRPLKEYFLDKQKEGRERKTDVLKNIEEQTISFEILIKNTANMKIVS